MEFLRDILYKASQKNNHIVLPEGFDERIIKAAALLRKKEVCRVTILGNEDDISKKISKENIDLDDIKIINPQNSPHLDKYISEYYELRKHKGISEKEAENIVSNPLFFGAMMVRNDEVHGSVAGSNNTTGDVIRSALHCVGIAEGVSIVSGAFLMIIPGWNRMIIFADSAVVPDPDAEGLASIAISSAKTYEKLTDTEPIIAMLSFSTYGSSKHELTDKVVEATKIAKSRNPILKIDGELQVDTAVIPEIAKKKAPGSVVAGNANVLIFPDLNAGNIGYKLVQRFAKAEAVGPVVQGLRKPINDLSRGCSTDDIVHTAAITSLLADEK